ncbi:MAG: hypothetical protein FGM58_01725 [Acidimicrobiia bacterium]|nr:hypothetical protein [Acidimicrobiia bacterium]
MAATLVDNWRGEFDRALRGFDRIIERATERGDHQPVLQALGVSGMIWRLRGDDDRALADFDRAMALAEAHGSVADEVYLRLMRIAGGDFPDGVTLEADLERCRRVAAESDDDRLRAHVDLAEGWGLAATGRSEEAVARIDSVVPVLDSPIERAMNELRVAEIVAADGRVDEARARAGAALETFAKWRARYWSARAMVLLAGLDGDNSTRQVRGLLAELPADIAYVRLVDPTGSLSIELDGPCAARRDGQPILFLTRHAEAALRLVIDAGADGITVDELAAILWPGADPARIGQRVRTMLWQVRSALGTDAWRLARRRSTVTFNTVGCEVVGTVDRSSIVAMFSR